MRSSMHKLSTTAAFRFTQSCHKIPHKSNPTTMRLGKFPLLVFPATTGQPLTSFFFHPSHRVISEVQIGPFPVDSVCWWFSSVYPCISGNFSVPPASIVSAASPLACSPSTVCPLLSKVHHHLPDLESFGPFGVITILTVSEMIFSSSGGCHLTPCPHTISPVFRFFIL